MGLRKYIENLTSNSHDTDELIVDGVKDQDGREVLANINTGNVPSFSETVTGIERTPNVMIVIEVVNYTDDENGANNNLTMSVGNSINYDFALEDERLSSTYRTGRNQWNLIEPTDGDDFDQHKGRWYFGVGASSRPTIFGRGSVGNHEGGRHLAKGTASGGPLNPYSITFSASGGGDGVSLNAVVWKGKDRDLL